MKYPLSDVHEEFKNIDANDELVTVRLNKKIGEGSFKKVGETNVKKIDGKNVRIVAEAFYKSIDASIDVN